MHASTSSPLMATALAFVAACSGSHLQPREPTAGRPSLAVMTYNVNFGIPGDGPTLGAVRESGADVVLLQETTLDWEQHLRRELATIYPHIQFHHSQGAGGLGILSKFPFDEKATTSSPIGWFPAWRGVVHSSLGDIQILSVHLRPQVSDSGSWVSGYFSTGHYRHTEIVAHTKDLDQSLPTLVVGDFNERSGDAIHHVEKLGLHDVLDEFDLSSTWHWPTPLGDLRMTLDHLFHNDRLAPLNARVLYAGRSDHYPVVAAFELDKAP